MNNILFDIRKWFPRIIIILIPLSLVLLPYVSSANTHRLSDVSKAKILAYKFIGRPNKPSQPNYAAIKKLSPYCVISFNPMVGVPKIQLSTLLMLPLKSKSAHCPKTYSRNDINKGNGIVFLFPGYGLGKTTLLPFGTMFARHGFLSVLVDLPGQGESGGSHIGYGPLEARYINDLIRLLHGRHMVGSNLILMGISYGAVIALNVAAHNDSVSKVIAIAPFARIIPTIKRYVENYDPQYADKIPSQMFKRAISDAEEILGYRFAKHNPLSVVSAIHADVLYIAGSSDMIAHLSGIRTLEKNTPTSCLVIAKGYDHFGVIMNTSMLRKLIKKGCPKKIKNRSS